MHTKHLLLLGLLLSVGGCAKELPLHEERFVSLGTEYQLSLYGLEQKRAQEISRQVQEDLKFMDYAWHPWKPGPMGRINQLLASGEEFSANPSVLPLIIQAKQLYTSSHGLFNPATGELSQMWGFHSDVRSHSAPPDKAKLDDYLRKLPTMDDIEINGIRIRGHNPRLKLDFDAYVRGYAMQQILSRLQQQGISDASLKTDGSIKVLGQSGTRPWSVSIHSPVQHEALGSIELQDGESLFTAQGEHILDPRSGRPATTLVSALVIHADAAIADAAAHAIFVAGPEQWWQIARAMGVHYVLLVDNKGQIYMNPEMAERVEFALPLAPSPISGPRLNDQSAK